MRHPTKYHIASDIMDKVNKAIDACERKYKVFIKHNVTIEKIEKDNTPRRTKKHRAYLQDNK